MIIFAIAATLILIVWSGVQWASSGGDKGKLEAARRRLTWAIVGLIIVLLAFFIVGIFGYFFNVPIFG